jgi:predicted MFS family arabinose efflux permease
LTATGLSAAEEWKRGWRLVLACFVGFSFFSIMAQTLGVFMHPLVTEFGWSRTLVSSGITIASAATAILSPFFGVLIDRYGSRKVALPGLVTASVAISAFSLASGSATQWILLWSFYAVISISVKTTVWTAAIIGAFNSSQGLALGAMLSGTAAAQVIVPPLATWLIDEFGWRMAYAWLGMGWGSATFLLCWFFLYDVHSTKPAKLARDAPARDRPDLPGLSIPEAWRDTALWRIGISTFVVMLLTIGLLIHQIPILTQAGVSRTNAAWLASLAGVAGIAGKLISGVLLDRFRANWVGGLTLLVTALAFLLLMDGVHTPGLIVLAMVINGYAAGSKLQIASYLTARYGGVRNFGVIYGLITSCVAFGSGMGPMVAGFVFDTTGGYGGFLVAGTVGCVLCGLLIMSLPRYPEFRPAGRARPAIAISG